MSPVLFAFLVLSQDDQPRRRQDEIEKLQELEKREFYGEPSDELYVDYGAWFRPSWFSLRDGSDQGISRTDYDTRVWGDARYGPHRAYLRLSSVYWTYTHNDGPEFDDHELEGPRLDVGFYEVRLGEALAGPDRPWNLALRGGRQYVRLGSGLVYNNIGDGLTVRGERAPFSSEFFALRSQPHEDDIDRSRPNSDDQKRTFVGGRVDFTAISDHTPFLAFMVERDRLGERPGNALSDFTFDAEYYGAGMHGVLFAKGLVYDVEGWLQRGERFASLQRDSPEDVDAHAVVASLEYTLDATTHPRFRTGLMRGSGDDDRFRITNTTFGNTAGTDDNAFLGFGFVPTGYSLAPYLSNLQIWRAGGSIRPLDGMKGWDAEFEIGFDLYFYRKLERGGGISDPFAGFTSTRIGREYDAYLNWAMLSDLSLSVRYGLFDPSSAYQEDDFRPYSALSLLFSF